MIPKACLDTGVITQYYVEDVPLKVSQLMQTIRGGNCNAFIVSPVIAESYFQLCKLGGRQFAETCLNNFQRDIPHTMVTINRAIEYKAGSLKCQYREQLSYTDCFVIAVALHEKAVLHTTEKGLPKIKGLKVIAYRFK